MGFLRSTKGSLISDYFKPLHDIGPISAATDVVDVALFEDTRRYKGKKLAAQLKELCGIEEQPEEVEEITEL